MASTTSTVQLSQTFVCNAHGIADCIMCGIGIEYGIASLQRPLAASPLSPAPRKQLARPAQQHALEPQTCMHAAVELRAPTVAVVVSRKPPEEVDAGDASSAAATR